VAKAIGQGIRMKTFSSEFILLALKSIHFDDETRWGTRIRIDWHQLLMVAPNQLVDTLQRDLKAKIEQLKKKIMRVIIPYRYDQPAFTTKLLFYCDQCGVCFARGRSKQLLEHQFCSKKCSVDFKLLHKIITSFIWAKV
jgi:hypothetical protein